MNYLVQCRWAANDRIIIACKAIKATWRKLRARQHSAARLCWMGPSRPGYIARVQGRDPVDSQVDAATKKTW